MELPREIFKAYDIRGLYPTEINEVNTELLGKALGTLLLQKGYKTIVLGKDDRESSITLASSMASGLMSTGVDVIYTGVTVQPAIHYFTFLEGIDAAANITASHNPNRYNGIKIDFKRAAPLYGDELASLREICESGMFTTGKGSYREENLNPKYVDFVSSKFKLKRKIKVVVYCGNGATSEIYPKVLENIGAKVFPLRCYLDSEFPAGVPDPETGNFYPELASEVLEVGADVGVGFDGDGDRVGEVDETGKGYKADEVFLLYTRDVLTDNPGAEIIFDVKSSQTVENFVKELGGKPKMIRTGRSYFLDAIFNGKALLGGELSGHVYFKDDNLGYDDGIYAACRLLKIMDVSGKKLSELMNEFPKMYATPEIKIPCSDKDKFAIVEKLVAEIEKGKHFLSMTKIDGIRAKVSETGWFLIRASNTSPYLSLRVEGKDKAEVDAIIEKLAGFLAKYDAKIEL